MSNIRHPRVVHPTVEDRKNLAGRSKAVPSLAYETCGQLHNTRRTSPSEGPLYLAASVSDPMVQA
jgi:hypothetical protein